MATGSHLSGGTVVGRSDLLRVRSGPWVTVSPTQRHCCSGVYLNATPHSIRATVHNRVLGGDCATHLSCFACRSPHWHTFGEITGEVDRSSRRATTPSLRGARETSDISRSEHSTFRMVPDPLRIAPPPHPPTLPTVRSPGGPVPRRPSDRRIDDGSARRGPAFRAHRRSRAPGPTAARTRAPALTWWNTCAPTVQRDRTARRPPLVDDPDADRPRDRDEGARTR